MLISATEFKTNIGKYLKLVDCEDIFITKNGKTLAKLTNAKNDKLAEFKTLRGIIKNDVTRQSIKNERLLKHDKNID